MIKILITSIFFLSCATEKEKKDTNNLILFSDSFETGNLTTQKNDIYYLSSTNVSVSKERPKDGIYSLKFTFAGKENGKDSWSEQRLKLPKLLSVTIEYDLFIPENYYHRDNEPSNNKFIAIFNNDYQPGFQVNWSLYSDSLGNSNLSIHSYNLGKENPSKSIGMGKEFISMNDRGRWIKIKVYVKVPSSVESTDGVMQLWKNDNIICDETNLNIYGGKDLNYIDEIYLLGWANSGFTETTLFYIDNLKIY